MSNTWREWTLDTDTRGMRLCVCSWNRPADDRGEAPTVILHGYLEQAAAWDRVAQRLGTWVEAPDHRGHGRSAHVGAGGWYYFWDYVADLDALVGALGRPVNLVGHSMGSTIAALYAGSRPELVRRLTLIESLGPPDMTEEAVARARQFLADRRSPPKHGAFADPAAAAARMRKYNPGISAEEALALATRVSEPTAEGAFTWAWDELHRARTPIAFQAATFMRFLAEITAPTLVVEGGESPWRLPDREARLAAFRAPVAVRTVAGAGHLVHHDAPAATAALIAEWNAS